MRGKLWFLGGLAAGFVLGARAGREKYEEIVSTARKVKEHPTVQEARGVVQEQANRLVSEGKDKLSQSKLAETKVGERVLSAMDTQTGAETIATRKDPLATTGVGTTPSTTTSTTSTPGTTTSTTSTTTPSSGSNSSTSGY